MQRSRPPNSARTGKRWKSLVLPATVAIAAAASVSIAAFHLQRQVMAGEASLGQSQSQVALPDVMANRCLDPPPIRMDPQP